MKSHDDPSIPVLTDRGLIYATRPMTPELSGAPVVTDFGQMRPMLPLSTDWWMPDLDRAPEILLKLPWGFPVDVWSVGIMVRISAALAL
ncbi:hypothetical protein FOPE_10920 [Fonsecaea pedrosoi]|nr:hypothetical protein FOPE_10920 [Fonsecaea pedrosoi]